MSFDCGFGDYCFEPSLWGYNYQTYSTFGFGQIFLFLLVLGFFLFVLYQTIRDIKEKNRKL